MKKLLYISLLFCINQLHGQIQCWEGTFSVTVKEEGCLDNKNGEISIRNIFGFPFKYSLNGVPSASYAELQATFNHLTAGQYTLVTESVFEPICNDTIYVTVKTDTLFNFSNQLLPPECNNLQTGAISIQPNAPYDFLYSIDSGQTFQTDSIFHNLSYGNFPIVVEGQNTPTVCKGIKTVILEPYTFSSILNSTPSTCDGSNGTLSAITVGGYPPYTYQWFKNNQLMATTPDVENVSFGNYDLVVTDSRNCVSSDSIEVEIRPPDLYVGMTSCHDTEDGFISILPSLHQFQYATQISQQYIKKTLSGDIDNDGDIDLYFINDNVADSIWLNDGAGNFSNLDIGIGEGNTATVSIGNLMGDDQIEIIRIDESGTISISYLENGLLSSIELGIIADNSTDVAIGDLDNDGYKDIIIARKSGHLYLVNQQDNSFVSHSFENAYNNDCQLQLADINNNGFLDVLFFEDGGYTFFFNRGNFSFQKSYNFSVPYKKEVEMGDVDNDGDIDLVTFIFSNQTTFRIWLNDGNGQFQKHSRDLKNPTSSFDGGSFSLGDLNGDDHLDIVLSSWDNYQSTRNAVSTFWTNDGQGNFRIEGYVGNNIKQAKFLIQDFNGDNKADIFIANSNTAFIESLNHELWINEDNYSVPIVEWEDDTSTDLYRNNLVNGTYSATITYQNGCTKNITATVAQPVNLTTTLSSIIPTSCDDSKNGLISISPYSQKPPYSFAYHHLISASDTFIHTNSHYSLMKGDYTLTITDGNNCKLDTSFTVEGPPPLTLETIVQPASNCHTSDGNIVLSPMGGNEKLENTYTLRTENHGGADLIELADLDNDGDDDLIKRQFENCEIWENEGLGYFNQTNNIPVGTHAKAIKVADFNGDNQPDILLGNINYGRPYLQILFNHTSTFNLDFIADSLIYHVTSMDVGDIDNDNDIDIFLTGDRNPTTFLINDGDGNFSILQGDFNTSHSTWGGILGDLDNDGDLDAVGVSFFQLELLENQSNHNFELKTRPLNIPHLYEVFLHLIDINQDGLSDIISIDKDGNFTFFINQGNLNFDITHYGFIYTNGDDITDVELLDFDNDGDQDLLLAAGRSRGMLINQGNGEFSKSAFSTYPYTSINSFDFSDFDNDGDFDLYIADSNGSSIADNLFLGNSYTYAWNTPTSISNTLDSLSSGIYQVTVSDVKGCTTSQQIEVFSEEPFISATIDNNCPEENIFGQITTTVVGGQSPYTYHWSNGNTTAQIANLTVGTYRLTITDANNCMAYFEGIIADDCATLLPCENELNTTSPSNITINTPTIVSDTVIAINTITAKGNIETNQQVVFKAGQNILLQPGFSTTANSSFLAKIETCSEAIITQNQIIPRANLRKLNNNYKATKIQIRPNPFYSNVMVDLLVDRPDLYHFLLMDLQGKVIMTNAKYFDRGEHMLTINSEDLSAGMYLLQLRSKHFQTTHKIIKMQ